MTVLMSDMLKQVLVFFAEADTAHSVLPIFKVISTTFAVLAVWTGAQATIDPRGFAKFFGLPVCPALSQQRSIAKKDKRGRTKYRAMDDQADSPALAYVSLMGIRQFATGIILLVFGYQGKWNEAATVLAIIGLLVAGTDGIFLLHAGHRDLALFHAIPGALIAAFATLVIFYQRQTTNV